MIEGSAEVCIEEGSRTPFISSLGPTALGFPVVYLTSTPRGRQDYIIGTNHHRGSLASYSIYRPLSRANAQSHAGELRPQQHAGAPPSPLLSFFGRGCGCAAELEMKIAIVWACAAAGRSRRALFKTRKGPLHNKQ